MRQLWFIMAMSLMLSACSSLNRAPQEAFRIKPQPQQTYQGEMTPDLMYAIMLAEVAVKRDNLDVAVNAYLYAAEFSRDTDIAARATRLAIYAKRYKDALTTARIWEQAQPDNQELKHVLALLYLRNHDLETSLRYIDQIFAAATSPQAVFAQLSKVLSGEENHVEVLELMSGLVQRHKTLPEAHLAYASLAVTAKEYPSALKALEQADRLQPKWWPVYELRSQIYLQQGQWPEAEESLLQAIKLRPKDARLGLRYARMLFQQGKYPEALKQFQRILALRPDDADVLFPLALLNMQMQDFAAAEQRFMQLVQMGQRVDDASYYLGILAERDNRLAEAQQWYQSVRQGENVYPSVRRYTFIMVKTEGLEPTLDYLHSLSFESASDKILLLKLEAEVLISADNLERAMAIYTRALKDYPDTEDLLYARAILAERLQQPKLMERDLRRLLTLDPDNADAMNALGYSWADQGSHLQEAHKLLQRAHELKPDSGPIIDSLGWVLFRLGRLPEALPYLQRAYNMLKDAEVAAHLGEVYWQLGEQDKARKLWSEAAQREPEHMILQRVMKKYLP